MGTPHFILPPTYTHAQSVGVLMGYKYCFRQVFCWVCLVGKQQKVNKEKTSLHVRGAVS